MFWWQKHLLWTLWLHRQARSPLARLPLARPFFLAHTPSKHLLRRLSCYESLPKWYNVREHKFVLLALAHEILCHAMDGDNFMWWPEFEEPAPPLRKNRPLAAQLKSPFGDSCLNIETISVPCASPNGVGLVRTDCRHQLASSNKLPLLDQTPLPSHTSSYLKVRTRSLIFLFSTHLCVR